MDKEKKDERPLMVSIRCCTYNQEKYIRDALEGFVMQKTNFRFEAIVHDDVSTDGTADIIREYAEKYPDIIKPIYETENQHSKHDGSLTRIMDAACTGKYIAYCEGDDYWIDPLKLQKQVDFLEAHPEVAYSCHRFKVLKQQDGTFSEDWNTFYKDPANNNVSEFLFDTEYAFTKGWITLTLTQVVRRSALNFEYQKHFKYARDVHNIYYILQNGKGVCHSFVGGVYRINSDSMHGGKTFVEQFKTNYELYKELYEKTGENFAMQNMKKMYVKLIRMHAVNLPVNLFELNCWRMAVIDKLKEIWKGRN